MNKAARRTAALSAAAAIGIAAFASGCNDSSKETAKDAMSSASSIASSAGSVASSAAESATSAVSSALASPPTKIAGKDGVEYTVQDVILEKYNGLDATAKEALGTPKAEQVKNDDGGVYQQFDGGVIINSDAGAYVVWGKIRDKWNDLGGSQGILGYPTSDETTNAAGQKQTTFQHGAVTWAEGADEAVVAGS